MNHKLLKSLNSIFGRALSDFQKLPSLIADWRAATERYGFKPYGYGTFFDLDADPAAPLQFARGIRIGRNALIDLWKRQEAEGVSHVALNLKPLSRPINEVLDELAEHVLPHFSGTNSMSSLAQEGAA